MLASTCWIGQQSTSRGQGVIPPQRWRHLLRCPSLPAAALASARVAAVLCALLHSLIHALSASSDRRRYSLPVEVSAATASTVSVTNESLRFDQDGTARHRTSEGQELSVPLTGWPSFALLRPQAPPARVHGSGSWWAWPHGFASVPGPCHSRQGAGAEQQTRQNLH